MALGDFFRINMPYGMKSNDKGEWFVFNREYNPLGWNTMSNVDAQAFPVYVKYKSLTDKILLELAWSDPDGLRRDERGNICAIWLYNDATNPKDNPVYWKDYFDKIKKLSSLNAEYR